MNLEEELKFCVNGSEHRANISDLSPSTTLNQYLRSKLHLTGTKRMCEEGGCGLCIVAIERTNHALNRTIIQAANSCMLPVLACNGWKIQTIEGLRGSKEDYHFLQKVLAHFNGTQCGFCSPGMVMNMFCLSQDQNLTMKQLENSFGGNICRCTGYRPILEAFKTVCVDAPKDLINGVPDIEDFTNCQKNCRKSCNETFEKPHYFKLGKCAWMKVIHLNDLLQILKNFESSSYKLIAGYTSIGVYKNDIKSSQLYIDISTCKELTSWKISEDSLILGANFTLTESMALFEALSAKNPKFAYLKKLGKHIDLIANVPVRNLGTLGGNLMMKHDHHEFPSDIFLILEAINAQVIITDVECNVTKLSLQEFLYFPMQGKVLEKIVFPTFSKKIKFHSYKIMPRAQNAHALVNAAFLLELNEENIVLSARIVYGCINPSFVHALKAEKYLLKKQIFSNETLQGCFRILNEELCPDDVLPNPCPEFRKQLAISLLYKFILSIAPKNMLSKRNISGGLLSERGVSSGVQDFETNQSMYPVTKAVTKLEALAQTSGQAEYIVDMPELPNQLHGAFVLAKIKPLSVVKIIDASKALKMSGVIAFFDHKDIPGQNNFMPKEVNMPVKEEIFCSGVVRYFNQPVGLIVAETQQIAERAANLVDITYTSGEREALLTIKSILKSNDKNERVKLAEEIGSKNAESKSERVIKGSLELSGQYHFHMETQSCSVVPTEDGLDIYPGSQWLDLSHTAAATTLNIPANKINVSVRRLGGGFGGKISRNSLLSCAAALAAYKLKKPVKIWMPLETNMSVLGKRYPILSNYEVGIGNNGVIEYLDNVLYSDYATGGNEPNIPYLLETLLSTYKIDNWHVKAFSTHSDNSPTCWIRAPGSCEGLVIVESMMEHAAMSLNIDPLEFRMKHIDTKKNPKLVEFVDDFKTWAEIDFRKKEIAIFNEENQWKKRGLSVVMMTFPLTLFANYGVIVSIYQSDGSVSVAHGGVEMGQGINTKVAQVCAYKLGIPLQKISVKPSNNLIAPNAHITGGSLASESVCFGVIKACDTLLERIRPVRLEMPKASWEELIKKCYSECINLCSSSMASPKDPELNNYVVYGVCASEIELDILTGQHILKRVDLLEDAGDSLSPNIDIGQVEGAFVMGIGYFTTEQIIYNDQGELLTKNTWHYKPPGAKDIPVDFRVKFPKNNPNQVGVLFSKATAEPPLCLAVSVPLAIRHAVAAFKKEQTGRSDWYPLCGPSTVENTFMNCSHNFNLYKL